MMGNKIVITQIQLIMSSTSKFKATPTYSFKGKTTWTTSNNLPSAFPSPDRYNPEKISTKTSPKVGFAQSKRSQWKQIKTKQLAPGPGAHETLSSFNFKSKKQVRPLRTVERFTSAKNIFPAPNAYKGDSLILKRSASSYSIQKKTISPHEKIKNMNTYKPGPGVYEQPLIKYQSTSINIGRSIRPKNELPTKSPGPGTYEAKDSFNKSISSESKSKFPKQIRKIDFSLGQRSPGPCLYEKKSFMDELSKKQFSIRKKFSLKDILEKNPGPGQYQTPILNKHKSTPSIKIGNQSRISFTDKKSKIMKFIPGPGSHELEGSEKFHFRSTSSLRFKGKSVVLKRKGSLSDINIGPGQYETSRSMVFKEQVTPKYSIDSKTKRLSFTDKIQMGPGPGDYDPKMKLLEKSQFTHRIPNSARPNLIKHLQKLPGPGQYILPPEKRLGRQFKFSKELKKNYNQEKIRKERVVMHETYQGREEFPNPPKYMGVSPKIIFNEKKISQYL